MLINVRCGEPGTVSFFWYAFDVSAAQEVKAAAVTEEVLAAFFVPLPLLMHFSLPFTALNFQQVIYSLYSVPYGNNNSDITQPLQQVPNGPR